MKAPKRLFYDDKRGEVYGVQEEPEYIEYTRSDLCMSKNDHEIIMQAQTDLYEGIVARIKSELEVERVKRTTLSDLLYDKR